MSMVFNFRLDDEDGVRFKDRCEEMGISTAYAIRMCLCHCGMIPRRMQDMGARAAVIATTRLRTAPSINGGIRIETMRPEEHPNYDPNRSCRGREVGK